MLNRECWGSFGRGTQPPWSSILASMLFLTYFFHIVVVYTITCSAALSSTTVVVCPAILPLWARFVHDYFGFSCKNRQASARFAADVDSLNSQAVSVSATLPTWYILICANLWRWPICCLNDADFVVCLAQNSTQFYQICWSCWRSHRILLVLLPGLAFATTVLVCFVVDLE